MTDLVESSSGMTFRLGTMAAAVQIHVPRLGLHMARNAAGVVALLAEYGLDPERAARGIAGFRGVRRRFELRGTVGEVTLIDDYAHHPTEVAATVREAGARANGRVVAVFQPHLFTRTERFHREFGTALALADVVVVTDIYASREDPLPGVTGSLVADAAVRAGGRLVEYVPHLADVAEHVVALAQPGDLILTMGAGDITTIGPAILEGLEMAR
jgi:UDP-N-acetylmuramate--alanine ligase